MKMKKAIIWGIVIGVICHTANGVERMTTLNFKDAPLNHVLEFYAHITGMTVTVSEASYPAITIQPGRRLTDVGVVQIIESTLLSNGVVITRSQEGVTVTIDAERVPSNSIRTEYDGPLLVTPPQVPTFPVTSTNSSIDPEKIQTRFTGEVLRAHLIEYRRQLKEAGLPSPPLAPEEIELGIQEK